MGKWGQERGSVGRDARENDTNKCSCVSGAGVRGRAGGGGMGRGGGEPRSQCVREKGGKGEEE